MKPKHTCRISIRLKLAAALQSGRGNRPVESGEPSAGMALLALFFVLSCPIQWARGQDQQVPEQLVDSSEQDLSVHDDIEDLDLLELEIPIVVTAARYEQPLAAVPHAMSVITAEDIRWSGARSIPDALRLAAGVDVAELSFGNAAVSPRGLHAFTSRMVLVLVDGRQLYDSFFGGTLWGSWPFQLEDIERIEVIRGPGGVTWGANAVNGVINIITKDPADQLGLTLTTSGGSRGTFKQHLGYAFQEGKLRMRVSGEYEASDGFRKGGSILRNLEDDYKGGRIAVHAIYDKGPNDTLTLSAGSALLDGGYSAPPTAGFGLRRNPGGRSSHLLFRWNHQIAEDNHFELTGYVNEVQASNGVPAIDFRYQQIALQLSHTFSPGDAHTLTWGVDSRVDLLDATNADPFLLSKDRVSTAIIGLYLQDEWRFAPQWALSLGGRIDYEFYGGFQPSARAALSHDLTDTSMIYGAVSRAFQMSPPGIRFLDMPLLNGLTRVKTNRDVDPPILTAFELGYRGRFFDRMDTSVNLFWHEYRDMTPIKIMLAPPALIRMDIDNRASASIYGFEWDAKLAVTQELALLANYTFQEFDWDSSVRSYLMDAVSTPKHKFMLGARYSPTDDLHLSSHLYYVDAVQAPNPANPFVPSRIDPYLRLDLRAEYEFRNDDASIAVGVRNLLDPNHYEGGTLFINDAEVPRMLFAEFRMTIK